MEILISILAGITLGGISYVMADRYYDRVAGWVNSIVKKFTEKVAPFFPPRLLIILSVSFVLVGFSVSWFVAPGVFLYPLFERIVKERMWKKKVDRIETQLVDFLNFYASSIKAGSSLLQGFEAAIKASPDPLASSLMPVLEEVRLGKKLGEAVKEWAEKLESREGYIIGTTLTIFQETGGNLTEVLLKIAELVKRRIALKNKIDALTAMGRLQAIVMVVIGPFVAFVIAAMAPEMFNAALHNAVSLFLFIMAGIMEIIAIVIMRRLMKIEY